MDLRQAFPDNFKIFLETVDDAPCWAESGQWCVITLEVIT